ncbi:glycerophosphoryl diester phosphodiesterase membrane domain-containing protein [Wukongibacter baidiensis]|uniref:glycerophosphoryl diester phosphodiesterase membrane domain-containing protein n=1 Tax=Wukongibacter baidiensis TaxID=1723361 RepID=UPI003D7F7293
MNSKDFSAMSYTDVLDKAFNIHKKNIGTSALYLLIFYVISLITSFVLIFIGVISFSVVFLNIIDDIQGDFLGNDISAGSITTFTSIFIIILFLTYFIRFIREAGIIEIASKGLLNKRVRLEKALGQAFKNIPRILSILLAYSIIFIPIICVFAYLIFMSGLIEQVDQLSIGMIILGLGAACIYGYFATIFMFSIPVAVIEKLYFFKALKRSRILVKDCFWKLLGINILFYITVAAITYSTYSILGIFGGLLYIIIKSFSSDESTLAALLMIGNLLRVPLQLLFSLFISPVTGIFLTALYYNQRFKKEGYDMQLKLERLKENEKIIKENNSERPITYIDDSEERKI